MQIEYVAETLKKFDRGNFLKDQITKLNIERYSGNSSVLIASKGYAEFLNSSYLIGSEISAKFSYDEEGKVTELRFIGTRNYAVPFGIAERNAKLKDRKNLQKAELLEALGDIAEKYGIDYLLINPKGKPNNEGSHWDYYVFCLNANLDGIGLSKGIRQIYRAQISMRKKLESKLSVKQVEARIGLKSGRANLRVEKRRNNIEIREILTQVRKSNNKKSRISYNATFRKILINGVRTDITPKKYIISLVKKGKSWVEIAEITKKAFKWGKNLATIRQNYYLWEGEKGVPIKRKRTTIKTKESMYDFPIKTISINGKNKMLNPEEYIAHLRDSGKSWFNVTTDFNTEFEAEDIDIIRQIYYRKKKKDKNKKAKALPKSQKKDLESIAVA